MFTSVIKSVFSAVFSLIFALSGLIKFNPICQSKFNGTFIQSWMCSYWDDETWKEEYFNMEEIGVEYLIIQGVASRSSDGSWTVYYPSHIDDFKGCCYGDVIENALKNSIGTDVKIIIGLADFDNWWVDSALTGEYDYVCDIMSSMVEEISDNYFSYRNHIAGWYFTPEIDNILNVKLSLNSIANGLNKLIDSINDSNLNLPIMLSPYYSEYMTIPSVLETIPMWSYFFEKVNFREGDIFCPQDAIGAGWTRSGSLEKVWKMYYEAVHCSGKNIKLWANCECMNCANKGGLFSPPRTLETENAPCTLNRLIWQMNTASKYAENIIVFSYNHYYSPLTGNNAYNDAYKYYLSNGTIDAEKPSKPEGFEKIDNVLVWKEAEDNVGVAFYIVYRNDKEFSRIEGKCNTRLEVKDNEKYSVIAVDGSGNKSEFAFL